jgi:putative ATP-dependent endonuclease of OLD family
LDIDCGRYGGGWGRIKYAIDKLYEFDGTTLQYNTDEIPKWDDDTPFPEYEEDNIISDLEKCGIFFSSPIDLDIMMIQAYPNAYKIPSVRTKKKGTQSLVANPYLESVLGSGHKNEERLDSRVFDVFEKYCNLFKRRSKPGSHLEALSELTDADLVANIPPSLKRLSDTARSRLETIPE